MSSPAADMVMKAVAALNGMPGKQVLWVAPAPQTKADCLAVICIDEEHADDIALVMVYPDGDMPKFERAY